MSTSCHHMASCVIVCHSDVFMCYRISSCVTMESSCVKTCHHVILVSSCVTNVITYYMPNQIATAVLSQSVIISVHCKTLKYILASHHCSPPPLTTSKFSTPTHHLHVLHPHSPPPCSPPPLTTSMFSTPTHHLHVLHPHSPPPCSPPPLTTSMFSTPTHHLHVLHPHSPPPCSPPPLTTSLFSSTALTCPSRACTCLL